VIFGNTDPATLLAIIVALLVGITFHEFSHALVADALGDHRPRALGRISLNPAAHIDLLGALFLLLVGFGWGKPVPVNTAALGPGRQGLAWVSAAGPVANLLVAIGFAVLLRALILIGIQTSFVVDLLAFIVLFNLALGIFNLLPIAPLDGWNFTLGLVPLRTVFTLQRYQQYGMFVLLGLIILSYGTPGGGPIGWIFGLARIGTNLLIGVQLFAT
jgi:Zn-dependent protease